MTPEMAAAFGLELQETTRVSGATDDEDDVTMAIVNLNSSGSGEIVYERHRRHYGRCAQRGMG